MIPLCIAEKQNKDSFSFLLLKYCFIFADRTRNNIKLWQVIKK